MRLLVYSLPIDGAKEKLVLTAALSFCIDYWNYFLTIRQKKLYRTSEEHNTMTASWARAFHKN